MVKVRDTEGAAVVSALKSLEMGADRGHSYDLSHIFVAAGKS